LFDKKNIYGDNKPVILMASDDTANKLFESYEAMSDNCLTIIGDKLISLFESQIMSEHQKINERNNKIVSLNEEQKNLNTYIQKVQNLKSLADEKSPAMDKLNEQENILNEKLNKNITDMNFYKNEFSIR